jgi:hypothetical protein
VRWGDGKIHCGSAKIVGDNACYRELPRSRWCKSADVEGKVPGWGEGMAMRLGGMKTELRSAEK